MTSVWARLFWGRALLEIAGRPRCEGCRGLRGAPVLFVRGRELLLCLRGQMRSANRSWIDRTFVMPTLLASEPTGLGPAGLVGGLVFGRFPSISCASFCGFVPNISWARLALRSLRPVTRELSCLILAFAKSTHSLAELHRGKLRPCPALAPDPYSCSCGSPCPWPQ